MGKLQDKVAVVTGAGRGIGKAIAEKLASEGAKVAIVSRTETNSQTAAEAINALYPGAAKGYAVDVGNGAAVAEMGKVILADFDHVDILVNNAGVTKDGLLLRMSEEDWDFVVDTNLKGAFNIGLIGNAGQANYAASKAGLIGFTKSVAREFAGRGVTANVIAPGFIATDMTGVLDEKVKAAVLEKIPLGDFGQAEDIAAAVLFLASPEARYITGQVLAVDGGMVM
jgi:3-oxoacyl-[acyl-carrier protein] reductase